MAIAVKDSLAHYGFGQLAAPTLEKIKTGNTVVVALATVGANGGAHGPKHYQRLPVQVAESHHGDLRLSLFVRSNIPGGKHSPKFTWSVPCQFAYVVIELSGAAQTDWTSVLDGWVQATNKGQSTNPNTVSSGVTTTNNNEMFLGFVAARHNNLITNTDGAGALAGWTRQHNPHSAGANDATKVSLAAFSLLEASSGTAPDLSKTIQTPANESRQWVAATIALIPSGTLTQIKGSPVSFRPEMTLAATITGGTAIIEPPAGGPPPSRILVRSPVSGGYLWHTSGTGNLAQAAYYSSDGAAWVQQTTYTPSWNIVAAAGDPAKLWVWEHAPNHQRLVKLDTQTQTVYARTHTERPPLGMAVLNDSVYRWTGNQLYEYDTTVPDHSLPLSAGASGKLVHTAGPTVVGASGDICTTDTSLVYYVSQEGETHVYEYTKTLTQTSTGPQLVGAGSVLWNPGLGFTAKAMCVAQGTIFLLGDYNGRLVLIGLPPSGVEQVFGYIRTDLSLTARSLAAGIGNTVLIGATDSTYNYVWVYDAGLDSFSLLDRFTRSANGDVDTLATFKGLRVAALSSSSTVKSASWGDDLTSDGSATGVVVTGAWDYNIPEQTKVLIGFNVLHSTTTGAETFRIDHDENESGSFTTGVVQTPAVGTRSTFVQITSKDATTKFKQVRLRINYTGLQIYSVSALAHLPGFYETWDLILRLKDENPQQRATGTHRRADDQRDNIITAHRNEVIVEFIDGYAHLDPTRASTYSVRIEDAKDIIARAGEHSAEGVLQVKLRNVVPSS